MQITHPLNIPVCNQYFIQVLMNTEYDNRYFPKRYFPRGNFSTVLFPKRHLPMPALATALDPTPGLAAGLGPLTHPSRRDTPPLVQPSARRLRGLNLNL